jgi:hypothetical protein
VQFYTEVLGFTVKARDRIESPHTQGRH